jgi:phosphomannomutase
MLTRYLGVDRKLNGRIVVSHVTTRLIETIAGDIPNNDNFKPLPNAIPPYLNESSYQVVVGSREELATSNVFTVPVGLKYIVEVPQMDRNYQVLKSPPANWRDQLLLGGEEASGLTTKGHVPDKDGIWAALLIIDMMAFYQQSLGDIWSDVSRKYWPSHTKRLNLDVPESAKAKFINHFLDEFSGAKPGQKELAGLRVMYAGGIRDKLIEMRLEDSIGSRNHYLFSRPSGTEPLVRVYLEGESEESIHALDQAVQARLEAIRS